MRKLLCGSILLLCVVLVHAQPSVNLIDSLKHKLARLKAPADRVEVLADMARMATNNSIAEADNWGRQMTEEAELSRDRRLIIKALLVNGERYSFMAAKREYLEKAIAYYREGLAEARREKLDAEQASAYIYLASAYLSMPDYEQAARHAQQALSVSTVIDDDSLKTVALNANGDVYLARKERLFALRYYLNALRLAETHKQHKLLRACYGNLSRFYSSIDEFDKAIDFAQKALNELAYLHEGGEQYNRVIDLCGMGSLYSRKKGWDMSQFYFEKALKLADSLRYPPLKMPAYNGLLNLYIDSHQPERALAYFNERADLRSFAGNFGLGYVIDMAYGVIYTDLARFDTAQRYFESAAPFYERSGTPRSRLQFYSAWGELYKRWGNTTQAIALFERARQLADALGSLEAQKNIANELDSLYAQGSDFRQSYHYKGLFVSYKDSLQKLGEEKDLLQVEIADEQQRHAREEREREAELERKHTLQYMGITVAIAAAFVLLVLVGFFKVSASVIKVMGFFSFIFLFEFLILIADNKIHHWAHGEPLKVLGIKVLLIAALLPFHHWLEHKVVHYLASRKLHEAAGRSGIARLLRRKAPDPIS
jgi:tetratricopeptide (TPR) repeat protein